jgi:Tol biopolymer transport system component
MGPRCLLAPRRRCHPARLTGLVLVAILLGWLLPSTAAAQHFGGNKVQYRTFDFEVLQTEHFDIYFYPEAREGVELAARSAERWRTRLGQVLRHELSGRQPLILYASQPHFQQTNAIGGVLGEGTGGVTESLRRRIIMPLAGPLAATDHVLGHELVHAFQFDITAGRDAGGQGGFAGALRLPLWFVEGMAEYLSIGPVDAHTALWMRDAVRAERLPRVRDLNSPEYFPYRWGHAFWAYVAGRWGDEVIHRMLRQAARLGNVRGAIEAELGVTEDELTEQWHAALRDAAGRVAPDAQPASTIARRVTQPRRVGGELNVAPALSPDGRRIAFLSERSLFAIELYLADVETGEVIERVSRAAVDPHYSSLQFINSAGAWDLTGDRFAFAAITAGRAALAIYSVANRRMDREIVLEGVDEAFNPTWSPDGRQIAFTGLTGGLTDLFVVDVESSRVTRLTRDPFAEIHPAWSPDGRWIAFATDRFTTTLDDLNIGPLRIAVISPDGQTVRPIAPFEQGRQINPQWSPDSQAIFFLADPDGVTNAYRVALDGGAVHQVTDLPTGISGITATSPALSIAARAGHLAFTAYEQGQHQIYATADEQVLAGLPADPAQVQARLAAALLPPPAERRDGSLVGLLADARAGLPEAIPDDTQPYRARLGLEAIGAPQIAVGRDRFGAFGGGGIALSFSDMLGDHSLGVVTQLNASFNDQMGFRDLGGAVGYTNMRRRWNWGAYFEQAPYRSGGFGSGFATVEGQAAFVEQRVLYRQIDRSVGGVMAYPFSRAQRLEFTGTYRNLTFEQDVRTTAYSTATGAVLLDQRDVTSLGDPLHLAGATAALVWDTARFGATSPVLGQRYRLEVAPMGGTLNFTNVVADYRRYLMPVPFYTIAGRVLHVGRYGGGADDRRLTPLFIGYPQLVRGYDIGSFQALECGFDPGRCPQFERLIGSRFVVANAELRFPLLRPFGVTNYMYGPIPVEVAFFADAGVAWDRGQRPEFFGRDTGAVSSAGVAFRVNALGFAVVQLDLVRPFQRPERGWLFQFSVAPGF